MKKGLLFLFTGVISFFVGCQTLTPSINTPFTREWIADYNRLKNETPSPASCEGFKNLLKKDFPLNEMAALRGSTHCGEILKKEEGFPWAHDEWTQVKLDLADKNKADEATLVSLLLERSKQIPLREEKVKLVLRAQKESKNLSPELQKEVTDRLYILAPRLEKNYSSEKTFKVAVDFRSARDFESAISIYVKVLNNPKSTMSWKMKAFEGLIRVEKIRLDKEAHIKAVQRYANFLAKELKKKANRKFRTLLLKAQRENEITLARAVWTEGRRQQAQKLLENRVHEKRKSFSYAVHYWLLGRIEEEKKNGKKSLEWLRLSIQEENLDKDLEAQARWFLAWNLYKMGVYGEAIEVLKWFDTLEDQEFTKARALYWTATSFKKLNQTDEATETYQRLSKSDPLGYYGLLAKRELGEKLVKPNVSEKSSEGYFFRLKLQSVIHAEWVEWLDQMGEKELLKTYLDSVTQDYAKKRNQDDDVWLSLLKAYARAGEYLRLFQKLYALSPKTRDHLLHDRPELLFPTPYLAEIKAAGEQYKVEPELIYSIIRQESAFNKEARSPVDAFGLMQLLPKVARRLGQKINIEIDHYTDLYLPEKNIPLGAFLISQQRKVHKGEFISTVASYNASDAAIRGWKTYRARPDAVEFIEEIPYEETKSYVRLIIRNFAFYRLFLSPQNEIEFPEDLLHQELSRQ